MAKIYDLERRTEQFAIDVIAFCQKLPKGTIEREITRQLVNSSGSVAANYIEANESLSKKDFVFHIKICRKESKESRMWLRVMPTPPELQKEQLRLIGESTEFIKIFHSIVRKSE